ARMCAQGGLAMSTDEIANTVRSTSTDTVGRSLNTVGQHHFIIDSASLHEEISSGDAFLAGISSCGVNVVEAAARETGVPLARTEVTIDGIRKRQDPTLFDRIEIRFTLVGPSQSQADELVGIWQKR
ncbi:MAG TPA: OsmC family protein, partial [Chloroflexota bacterium]|nr:OsmC family protein [Chloroflexota bacterium]